LARKLLLASAGAGKSERIAREAIKRAASGGKVLLLTFTINNQFELVRAICRINKFQPENVVVKGWFSFLLEDMIRPYQRCILDKRVSGIAFDSRNPHLVEGATFYIRGRREKVDDQWNPRHYVTTEARAHTYYLAKLAARVHKESGGKPARRLAGIYDAVFIDEIQDLVGWDFEVIRAMVETGIAEFDCVGDFRQSIYETSETSKKPQKSAEKLAEFKNMGFEIDHLAISWRCIQSICDLADRLHVGDGLYSPTKSQIAVVPPEHTEHQGVFAIPASRLKEYIEKYNPTILRRTRQTEEALCEGRAAYNFGESKGMGFARVLIIPPDPHAKFLCGDTTAFEKTKTDESRNKLYVAITRAKYSVAFCHKGGSVVTGAQIWNPQEVPSHAVA
jgi:DNA helicase-2/ATP-dependent DNA helicase PcrA